MSSGYQSLSYASSSKPKSHETWVNLPSGATYELNTNAPVGIAHGPAWAPKTPSQSIFAAQSLSKSQRIALISIGVMLILIVIFFLLRHFGVLETTY